MSGNKLSLLNLQTFIVKQTFNGANKIFNDFVLTLQRLVNISVLMFRWYAFVRISKAIHDRHKYSDLCQMKPMMLLNGQTTKLSVLIGHFLWKEESNTGHFPQVAPQQLQSTTGKGRWLNVKELKWQFLELTNLSPMTIFCLQTQFWGGIPFSGSNQTGLHPTTLPAPYLQHPPLLDSHLKHTHPLFQSQRYYQRYFKSNLWFI